MQIQLTATPREFLRTLLWLRISAVTGQSATVLLAYRWLGVELPLGEIAGIIALLAATVLLTMARLRKHWPTTQVEIVSQLLVDIGALTALLYLSGGATNPFASLYLVPIALAAVGLAWLFTVSITLVCIGCYVTLMDHFMPLTYGHRDLLAAFNLHVLGMGVNFVISAALLAAALAVMAAEMHRRDLVLANMREDTLRREHITATGLLAAGAAHEISTPLFAMSLLAEELRSAEGIDEEFIGNVDLLSRQIELCKERITLLLDVAGQPRSPRRRVAALRQLMQEVLDRWRIVRPASVLEVAWQVTGDPWLSVDDGFSQTLINLLNNAADASAVNNSDHVSLSVLDGGKGEVRLAVEDEGPGLETEIRQQVGKAMFTTKREGFGLGLVLSHANLERLGGRLTCSSRPGGGTRVEMVMPWAGNARD